MPTAENANPTVYEVMTSSGTRSLVDKENEFMEDIEDSFDSQEIFGRLQGISNYYK